MKNADVAKRRVEAISRGVGMQTQIYADRALNAEKRRAVLDLLTGLTADRVIHLDPRLKTALTDQILMTLTFWLANDALYAAPHDGRHLIHKTVFQVMCQIVPYMGEAGIPALSRMVLHFESVTAK